MKQYPCLLILIAAFALPQALFAQKKPKHPNRFDSTLARQNELSVVPGFMGRGTPMPRDKFGQGPSFSVEYARVYKANHFLRTGLSAWQLRSEDNSAYRLPAGSDLIDPSTPGQNPPVDQHITASQWRVNDKSTALSGFIGYEYGVGRGSFRFTFGVDLHVGYMRRQLDYKEDVYQQDRLYDPVTNLYHYNIQFLQTGSVNGTSNNIYMSLVPRIGIRRDLGRRVALALTFTPQVGFSQRLGYSEKVNESRPPSYYMPKSYWFSAQCVDIRVIFKLGKLAWQ